MADNLRPLARCGEAHEMRPADVQWAAELAFADARMELAWSLDKMARRFAVSRSTVKRWLNGSTPIDLWTIESVREFADVWWERYFVRREEIRAMAERRAA